MVKIEGWEEDYRLMTTKSWDSIHFKLDADAQRASSEASLFITQLDGFYLVSFSGQVSPNKPGAI